MAKIPLKEIVFPGLDNTYTIPEIDNTLSTAGKAADAKKTGDEISELKEDLTATNAELLDIRVGADGTTHNSAGAAVRGQISDLKEEITEDLEVVHNAIFNKTALDIYRTAENYQLTTAGNPQSNASYNIYKYEITSGYIYEISTSDNWQFSTTDGINPTLRVGATHTGPAVIVAPNTAQYLILSDLKTNTPSVKKYVEHLNSDIASLESAAIKTTDLTLSAGLNKFNSSDVTVGKEVYSDGSFATESKSAISGFIPVHGARKVYLYNLPTYATAEMGSRFSWFYDESKTPIGSVKAISKSSSYASFTVPSGAYYYAFSVYQRVTNEVLPLNYSTVMVTFEPTEVDFEAYTEYVSEIKDYKLLSANTAIEGAEDLKVVIFGDSITETASMDDDGTNYVEGTRHNWPEFANDYMQWGSFKNYAKTGATYKDQPNGSYRQSVSNQIALAIADGNNDDADIIVCSLGTNDGISNIGDYDTAMGKSTPADLDRSLLYEALRYAFWTIRTKYKNAVCFAGIPIQRADIEPPAALYEAIEKMAHRYDFIIIDGAYKSGIVKENNTWNASGNDLEDGLHPNTVGQIKIAKLYTDVILQNYLWRK